jgi:hypothetical protein
VILAGEPQADCDISNRLARLGKKRFCPLDFSGKKRLVGAGPRALSEVPAEVEDTETAASASSDTGTS